MSKKNIGIVVVVIIILVIIIAFFGKNAKDEAALENAGVNATSTAPVGGAATGGAGTQTGGTPVQGGQAAGFTFRDFTLRMGQTTVVDGVKITPLAVEQDSRCAVNVQCIQAGTVRVSMKFEFNNFATTKSMISAIEMTTDGVTGTIISASPEKVLGKEIKQADYSFVLRVKTKA